MTFYLSLFNARQVSSIILHGKNLSRKQYTKVLILVLMASRISTTLLQKSNNSRLSVILALWQKSNNGRMAVILALLQT
ncbi:MULTISPECIES: hypothetical protein [Arsenophonus]|uniref:hypothetical protein n=1 Tax=Arsenophonus TaxID=637 RepID=UPI0015D8BF77|nr:MULTISPECIES: hypothetical protein [Arsenophonus]UBX29724.1 hypothetical protein LDL57_03365 [Arsenophonus apicola]